MTPEEYHQLDWTPTTISDFVQPLSVAKTSREGRGTGRTGCAAVAHRWRQEGREVVYYPDEAEWAADPEVL